MSIMKVESLSWDNIEPLANLAVQLWADCTVAERTTYYKEMVGSQTQTCYLLKENTKYIGFIELNLRRDYVEGSVSSPTAYVEGIFVIPDHRRLGIGTELISAAERWAKAHVLNQLASDVQLLNSMSMDFHKAAGFFEVNRIVCFVKDLK